MGDSDGGVFVVCVVVCLRLVHDDGGELSGRIAYADEMLEEFALTPAVLV